MKSIFTKNEDCKELRSLVKKNWEKHPVKDSYVTNTNFLDELQRDYKNCILDCTKDDIIKIFGKPVTAETRVSYYFLNESCLEKIPEDCKVLIFYFDEETKKVYIYQPEGYNVIVN